MHPLFRSIVLAAAERYARQQRPRIVSRHTVEPGRRGFYVTLTVPPEKIVGIGLTFPTWPRDVYIDADVEVVGGTEVAVTLTQTYQRPVDVEVTLWLKGAK